MPWLDRLRALFKKEEPPAEPQREPEALVESEATRAARAIVEARYLDALSILKSARDHDEEASVVDAIVISLPESRQEEAAGWDALIVQLADVLVARGERRRACDQLKRAHTAAALVLRADLLCEGLEGAATSEELDLALSLYADALRIDIDAPGARERWERLRARLGRAVPDTQPALGATLLGSAPSLPFTLLREVARGGAGVVYEARAALGPAHARTVALKIAHQRSTAKSWIVHEAQTAVRFRGPGVVPILDVDPEEGWLAMAWAAGGSLRARLRSAHDVRVDEWLVPLLETLADVHAAGWIHGDLKPANVLFDERGRAWLGDFALARAIGDAATPGSAGYVSPERLAGAPCDPRDDVFAIGKILVELVERGADARLRAVADCCLAPAQVRLESAQKVLAALDR